MPADRTLVLRGGSVRTLDPERPIAHGVVVEGGRIAALLGPDDVVPAGAERLDLDGGCALPAFTDAHVHFPSWAVGRRELGLFEARSLAEAVDAVARAAARLPAGAWLRGRGWRDELWPKGERPDRAALDAAAPDLRVALRAHDGHSVWLNSAALACARGDLAVAGGVVETDEHGEPTGILREESAWRFLEDHAEPPRAEALGAMRAALPVAAAAGVTAVHDKDGGRGAPELFAALRAEGVLTLRVWQSIPADAIDGGDGDYVKAFMDGTLGSRTARLLDGSGVEITSTEELVGIIRRAAAEHLAVAVHAIGDRANRDALDAFEQTAGAWRPLGLRPRIEHAQCIAPDDVPRFARLGVAASVQFTHATSDRELAERLWADRLDRAYPYRSLLDAGAVLAGGSDAPVEELDPLAGLRAAVLRTTDARPAWRPDQALPLQAALEAFTVNPAWLSHDEDRRGRLKPGFDADIVVLDRDPFARPPEELTQTRVLATLLDGERVF